MATLKENQIMDTRQILELFERIWPLAYLHRLETSVDVYAAEDSSLPYLYGDGVHVTLEFSLSRSNAAREGFADKRGIGTGEKI